MDISAIILLIIFMVLWFLIIFYKPKRSIGNALVGIDHLSIFTQNLPRTIEFYEQLFGEKVEVYEGNRYSIYVGNSELKFIPLQQNWAPKWIKAIPGSIDICFKMDQRISQTIKCIQEIGIPLFKFNPNDKEIYKRHGRFGKMESIYIKDPNDNLLEFAHY